MQTIIPGTEETQLDLIMRLGQILKEKQAEADKVSEKLKGINAEIRKISQEMLPEQMEDLGIEELTLSDGTKISLSAFYNAKIPEPLWQDAMDWLDEHNHSGIVKSGFSVALPKGERETAKKLAALLWEHGYRVNVEDKIHPMTLRSFVKEQIEAGEELPKELFGVYEGKIVKFK